MFTNRRAAMPAGLLAAASLISGLLMVAAPQAHAANIGPFANRTVPFEGVRLRTAGS